MCIKVCLGFQRIFFYIVFRWVWITIPLRFSKRVMERKYMAKMIPYLSLLCASRKNFSISKATIPNYTYLKLWRWSEANFLLLHVFWPCAESIIIFSNVLCERLQPVLLHSQETRESLEHERGREREGYLPKWTTDIKPNKNGFLFRSKMRKKWVKEKDARRVYQNTWRVIS